MLGLTVQSLGISVKTNGGEFSRRLELGPGLNIIRAENTSGKSTCINAIAYGLGLEAILGPSRNRPFPKSLYSEIFKSKKPKDQTEPLFVKSSAVSLAIENSSGVRALLTRDVLGADQKISVDSDGEAADYFLGASGHVGSAASGRGFHHWLANFIGWALPKVVTYEGKEVPLYLECIFPLFFVEQKRGWSEIQANIPTHYGIKNVKRVSAEFCLGIDTFEFEKSISDQKIRIERAETEWEKLSSTAEAAADFHSVELTDIPPIDKYRDAGDIQFSYIDGDALISVAGRQRALKRYITELAEKVADATPNNSAFEEQSAILRKLRRNLESASESVELKMMAIAETESKISTLARDLDQYQQLRRLRQVGSSIEADLNTEKCPICESDLYDTLGNRTVNRQPMTLEENIEFLKNQIEFFENVRKKKQAQLHRDRAKVRTTSKRLEAESEKLASIREDMNDINGATRGLIREKVQAESALKDADKLAKTLAELRERAQRAHSRWVTAKESLRLLRKQSTDDGAGLVIRELEFIIRTNLAAFKFNPSAISSISLSRQTLRPEQDGYDIVAETSASDYIRIIWAYTLALMELAGKRDEVRHGGFVIFDEPRQHEASKISFANLIDSASKSRAYSGQVIFATSLDKEELELSCEGKEVNVIYIEDDYVLIQNPDTADAKSEATAGQ